MALQLDKLLSAESIPLITVVIGVGVVSLLLARACGKPSSAPSPTEAPEQPPAEDKSKAKKKKKKKKASAKQETTSDEEDQDVKVTKKEDKKGPAPATPESEEKKLSKAQARRKRQKAKKAGDDQRKEEQVEKDKQLAAAKRLQEKATQRRVEKLIQQQKKADADGFIAAPTRRNVGRVLRPSKENEHLSTRRDVKEPEPVRETTSITLTIPTKSLGLIIGKEGKTIKAIQKSTSTQILTPKDKKSDGTPEVSIKITGDAEGVVLAKQAINDLLTKGFSTVIDPAAASGTVFLENEKQIGILIGPDGIVIQKFQNTLGVTIKMPSPGDRKLAVVISGPKEAVKEARQSIKDLLDLGYSKILDPTWTHVEVPFPPSALGRLIGVRGQNLKSIKGNTGCSVNIPKVGSDKKDSVIIVGPISKIESAKKQVLRWAEEQQEQPTVDPYDPWGEGEEENYDNEW